MRWRMVKRMRGRFYIADRGNSRIQVFDEEWKLLDLSFSPRGLAGG